MFRKINKNSHDLNKHFLKNHLARISSHDSVMSPFSLGDMSGSDRTFDIHADCRTRQSGNHRRKEPMEFSQATSKTARVFKIADLNREFIVEIHSL